MAALAGNFYFFGAGFLAGLTAVFFPRFGHASARYVCTFSLIIGGHDFSAP